MIKKKKNRKVNNLNTYNTIKLHFSYSIFSRFIIFTHLEITLLFAELCYSFEGKLFSSATIIL